MKILIPVDSSAQSRRVLEILGEHESLVHAKPEIELVNVQYSVPEAIIKLLNLESVKAYYQAEGAKVFEAVGAEAFCRRTGAKTKVLYGEAAKAIVAEADAWQADLIVMGNRGLNPMRGLFLGSVSNGVLSQTRVPMLLLRENSKPVAGKRRIGIFVDGSPYGEAAAEYVLSHLELFGPEAEFEVVYAAEPIQEPIAPNPIGPIAERMTQSELAAREKADFEEAVRPVAERFKAAGKPVRTVFLTGDASEVLPEYANANLTHVVMGSHGYGNFTAAVLGSTAMHLAADTELPILVVRRR